MSVMQKEAAMAGGATVENVFSGSAFEFARQNSLLNMAIVGSAAGLVATIQVGSRVVLEESPLALLTTMPKLQDDFYYSEGVLANERIICRVRNTTAATTLTYRVVAQLQPV